MIIDYEMCVVIIDDELFYAIKYRELIHYQGRSESESEFY